jgi:hypothetical protein
LSSLELQTYFFLRLMNAETRGLILESGSWNVKVWA